MYLSNESFDFTKQLEDEIIRVEILDTDKYGRSLGYIFYKVKLWNEELLKNGLAHFYSYSDDKYTNRLKKAEASAMKNEIGLWKKSSSYGCVSIVELKYTEDGKRCTNKERLTLQNFCEPMEIYLKDDATHDELIDIPHGRYEMNFSCIFNDDGDSLFIWKNDGLLAFERY